MTKFKTPIKLISWNVNGLRACLNKDFEKSFAGLDADVFCLQEIKLKEGQTDYAPVFSNDTNVETSPNTAEYTHTPHIPNIISGTSTRLSVTTPDKSKLITKKHTAAIAAAPHTDEYAVVSYNSAPLPENITNIPQNIYASIKYLTKGAARPDTAEIYSSNVEIFSSDAFAPIT